MTSCAFGPCDRSRERGGKGCNLCDVVSKLPQPAFKAQNALPEQEEAGTLETDERRPAAAAPKPRAVRKPKGASLW